MKRFIKTFSLLCLIFVTVWPYSVRAYFPYINSGGDGDKISQRLIVSSVSISKEDGTELKAFKENEDIFISCRVKKAGAVETNVNVALVVSVLDGKQKVVKTKVSEIKSLTDFNPREFNVCIKSPADVHNLKVYLWDGLENLVPLAQRADFLSESFNVTDVTLDGKSVKAELDSNNNEISVELGAYRMHLPEIQIFTDNIAARCEIKADREFPFSKQGDTAPQNGTVTATVSLGENVKTYIFKFTQEAPQIIEPEWYIWKNANSVSGDADYNEMTAITPKQDLVFEASYDAGYTRKELRDNPTVTKLNGKTNLPSEFTALHSNKPTWMIFDISPELVGGTLLKIDDLGNSNNSRLSLDNLRGFPADEAKFMTFKLNRSSTVYVWNNSEETAAFTAEGFEAASYVGLSFNNNGGNTQHRDSYWYKKHIEVNSDERADVNIPVGFRAMPVIVKFDNINSGIIKNAVYTDKLGENTADIKEVYEPIPVDDGAELYFSEEEFLYKEKSFSNKNSVIYGISEEILGGEILLLPQQ